MKKDNMIDAINNIDSDLIENYFKTDEKLMRAKATKHKPMWIQWGAMAACFMLVFAVMITVLPNMNKPGEIPIDNHNETLSNPNEHSNDNDTTNTDDRNDDPVIDKPDVSIEQINMLIKNMSETLSTNGSMGGGSYLFNREYVDETYNIAYLGRIYRGEKEILPEGALDAWVNDVFLKQTPEKQNELPTIYQAVRDLRIPKEDLIELNESRKQQGDEMILPDSFIDALYLPEDEMKSALVNQFALYYNGNIYTLESLYSASTASAESNSIPTDILFSYINNVAEQCVEQGYIEQYEVERIFGDLITVN